MNIPSPSALPRGHTRRSVSFSLISFFGSPPTHDLQDLKDGMWYTSEDEDQFKADAQKELDAFKLLKERSLDEAEGEENSPQHQDMCIFGLEQYLISLDHTRKRARAKKLTKYAVLDAQARGLGFEQIAETARRYSAWSVAQAKMVGDFQCMMCNDE